jgi:cysteinyl-tRNA synthetase
MKINLFNSLKREIEEFKPIKEDCVSLYTCGPTVYDYAHIGNMRSFLFADLLQRTLKVVGEYKIKWVMNVTDIDDKTIQKSQSLYNINQSNLKGLEFAKKLTWANEEDRKNNDLQNLKHFTNTYTDAFIEDIEKLGISKSDFHAIPKATDYIPKMQDLIRLLLKNGFAYISEGSVYFNVAKYREKHKYGKLFNIDFDNFKAGTRIDSDQYEREQVNDFVLWKAKKDGEPFWDFHIEKLYGVYDDLGHDYVIEEDTSNLPGRPGWHLECSAIEYTLFKPSSDTEKKEALFDIHTGGIDLKFPHHENEIAQSVAGYGVKPTNYWCHNEFLEVEGKKMSKSAGNYYTLRNLIEKGIDPLDIRFAMLSVHYRTKYNFTFEGIEAARKGRLKIQKYIDELLNACESGNGRTLDINYKFTSNLAIDLWNKITSELANDLHTPKMLSHIFSFININKVNKLTSNEVIDLIILMGGIDEIFNVWNFNPEVKTNEIPTSITELAELRMQAKKDKNFEESDRLRDEILKLGYKVVDTEDGWEVNEI